MSDLFLSDDFIFYTIEGEGRYVGCPSVFMRLSMCNLTCQGFKSKDSPFGCDSFVSWSVKNKKSFDEIFQAMEVLDPYTFDSMISRLKNGAIWKITGGEPFIQQKALIELVKAFAKRYEFMPLIDFETNGTIAPDPFWLDIATFTSSPKLANNGDPEEKRYKPEVLKLLSQANACFKFVVRTEEDVDEVIEKYIKPGHITRNQVWLMPCCGSREEQNEQSVWVAEMCKKNNFKFSPRLQLMIWNRALRV
jgi:organic radical activating enzyme